MGNSAPPPADFDLVGSYARRRGTEVEIVLADPKLDLGRDTVTVTLARGEERVSAIGIMTDDGPAGSRFVLGVSRRRFIDGVWSLTFDSGPAAGKRLNARLLVQGDRPLVLLWGATTRKLIVPKRRSPLSGKRRVAVMAGKALDQVLAALPAEKASQVRAQARTAARRVLG